MRHRIYAILSAVLAVLTVAAPHPDPRKVDETDLNYGE